MLVLFMINLISMCVPAWPCVCVCRPKRGQSDDRPATRARAKRKAVAALVSLADLDARVAAERAVALNAVTVFEQLFVA